MVGVPSELMAMQVTYDCSVRRLDVGDLGGFKVD